MMKFRIYLSGGSRSGGSSVELLAKNAEDAIELAERMTLGEAYDASVYVEDLGYWIAVDI
jgi:hypothetical protein